MLAGIGAVGASLLAGCNGVIDVEEGPDGPRDIPDDAWFDESVTGDISLIEDEVFRLTNEERQKMGAGELEHYTPLAQVVRHHCWDQIERGYFSHTSPEGWKPSKRVSYAGIPVNGATENIVKIVGGFAPDKETQIAQQMMNAFVGSVDHYEAMINSDFTDVGIGLYVGENGAGILGQLFVNDYMEKL